MQLPDVPGTGNTKPIEDQIDAVLCAFIAAHWWFWTTERSTLYGTEACGYIVVPHRTSLPTHPEIPRKPRGQDRLA
jgi:predicted RNase H-like nuclease